MCQAARVRTSIRPYLAEKSQENLSSLANLFLVILNKLRTSLSDAIDNLLPSND